VDEAPALVASAAVVPVHSFGVVRFNFLIRLLEVIVLISSFSFFAYGVAYFVSPRLKDEFSRFGLSHLGMFTAIFQILGAIGLLVGLMFNAILLIASGGLTLMMLLAIVVRIKVKDPLWAMLPAFCYLLLNAYILSEAMKMLLD